MSEDELRAEAEALGIEVDGRWGEKTLLAKISEAKAAKAKAELETTADGEEENVGRAGEGADDDGSGNADGDGDGTGAEGSTDQSGAPEGDAGSAEDNQVKGSDVNAAGAKTGGEETGEAADTPELAPVRDGAAADGGGEGQGEADPAQGEAGEPDQGDTALPASDELGVGDGGAPAPGVTAADIDWQKMAVLDVARVAMTGPIQAAFYAASAMYGAYWRPDEERDAVNVSWFAGEGVGIADFLPALVNHAAPFVRTWPEAPPEALYGHMMSAAHEIAATTLDWSDIDWIRQTAWTVFRDVLVAVDRAVAEEHRQLFGAQARETLRQAVDVDDTMFAPTTSRETRSDLGRARDA